MDNDFKEIPLEDNLSAFLATTGKYYNVVSGAQTHALRCLDSWHCGGFESYQFLPSEVLELPTTMIQGFQVFNMKLVAVPQMLGSDSAGRCSIHNVREIETYVSRCSVKTASKVYL